MCGEDQSSTGELIETRGDVIDHGFNEAGVIVVLANLVDHGGILDDLASRDNVFSVLATTRIRTGCRSDEGQRSGNAIGCHLLDGVGEHWVPVSVPPVHGEVDACRQQCWFEFVDERSVVIVDGAFTPEQKVVLADFFQAFVRDSATSGDILQEWQDIFGLFWSAEGHDQNCVVVD